ncbi:MAG: GGDEF domain-containing response regulator, partial [Deltaproteobacteria bacterium]|nr:GGDEF domain-containing response regulator [Deltaproteobacteria bacterium]
LERSGLPFHLEIAPSTGQAIDSIKNQKIDLVFSDHFPPEVNAIRLLQTLRERENELPVVLLTRLNHLPFVREAFRLGASDYFLKEELPAVSLADVISLTLERNRVRSESSQTWQQLEEKANRDSLTGLYNRHFLIEALGKEFLRTRRYGRPLCFMIIDLDGFKAINDNCGHQKGDQILAAIGRLLGKSVRDVDIVARFGGDEFVLLLPETELKAATRISNRILDEIRRNPFLDGKRIFPLSASIGISCLHPSHQNPMELIKEADKALYSAKRRGRNRSVAFHRTEGLEPDGFLFTQLELAKPIL